MKKSYLIMFLSVLFFSFSASAQVKVEKKQTSKKSTKTVKAIATEKADTKEETFTVYGNCNMCKRAIEGNAMLLKGVSTAKWDKATDQLTVSFDSNTISLNDIKQKIADIGYDSDTHRAKDEVYNNLPGCCQYDRPEIKVD